MSNTTIKENDITIEKVFRILLLDNTDRIGYNIIKANDEESQKYNEETKAAFNMLIVCLQAIKLIKLAKAAEGDNFESFGKCVDIILKDNFEEWDNWVEETFNGENSEYLKIPITGIGDVSDGYHTFNNLYYQRAVLFASIVNQNADLSWKSLRHEDGKYCFDSNGEWFIVGIDTPEGPYTYHYEYKYWDLFKCKVLKNAKHWDGHDENDVTRLLSL